MTDIDAYFKQELERFKKLNAEAMVDAMRRTTKAIAAEARQINTYKDQTRGLRGSIVGVVLQGGEVVEEDKQGQGGDNGNNTAQNAINVATKVGQEQNEDVVGVVAAGQHYALYVEAKGYDVITNSFDRLKDTLGDNLQAARDAITEAMNED